MQTLPTDPDVPNFRLPVSASDVLWPIGDDAFRSFAAAAHQAFRQSVANLAIGEERDFLLADVRSVAFLIQVTHAAASSAAAHQQDIQLLMGPQAQAYFTPDLDEYGRQYEASVIQMASSRRRLGNAKRTVVANALLMTGRRRLASLTNQFWMVGGGLSNYGAFAVEHGGWITYPTISAGSADTDRALPAATRNAVRALVLEIAAAAEEKMGSPPIAADPIAAAWCRRLETIATIYRAVARKTPPRMVILGGAGNGVNRAIAIAARQSGASVVGFQHGHNMGYVRNDIICFNDFAICNRFGCYSKPAIEIAKQRAALSPVPPDHQLEFFVSRNSEVRRLWSSRPPAPRETKRVMLLGYLYSGYRHYGDIGYHFLTRLDLEWRIINLLRRKGYEVVYKAHPECAATARRLIADKVDRFVDGPLETSRANVDAAILTYPMTTALGVILCSEIPIVLFDFEGQDWFPDVLKLLARRCALVSARLDQGNRVDFEEEDLVEALLEAPSFDDREFLEKHLLGLEEPTMRRVRSNSIMPEDGLSNEPQAD